MVLPKVKLTLIKLGFWYEYDNPNGMDPKLIVNYPWASTLKMKFSKYLKGACDMGAYCGYSWCRITGKSGVEFGCSDFTDGIFIWPEGLVDYLDRYNIELPEYFTKSVIDRDFKYNNENIKVVTKEMDPWITDPLEADPNRYIVNSEPWKKWSEDKLEKAKQTGLLQTIKPVWPK